ncbi:PaaI family thioesterase [Mangrovibacterium lignilyticum]|uniref:PaaI family thioesterase n=1 Tax=Mangrovibacterium lignilyticum TaxID=2668052 RepID=UPI0013D065D5|nr:PaaI family thioesterase [Mangrovibacterium lignilyticum]
MRKIVNAHRNDDPEFYQCIGCSPHNTIGLKLEFWEDGEELYAEWEPKEQFMGWVNVLHGGIKATMLDEISAWVVYVKCGTAGVTTALNVKYKETVYTNAGKLVLRAKLLEQQKRLAKIQAQLFNSEGKLCTEAEVTYFIFPERIAREKFHYPGVNAFFEEADA